MIEFNKAVEKDITSLKELWLDIFEETEKAVDLFFERIFPFETSYIATENNQLVAMVHLLPALVNGHKCSYLYAVATKKEFRGQGISRRLIDFALADSNAELCVTLPATESLYNFYGDLGFEKLYAQEAKLSRDEVVALAKPYNKEELFVGGYCGIRNRVLKNNFLSWNNNHIDYSFEYNEIYGGKIIKSNFGYAISFEKDGVCIVTEFICADENAPKLLTDILNLFSSKEFIFHLSPNQHFIKSEEKVFGMVKFLSDFKPENIYCGLTLD